jgi:hypothetical protein
LVCPKHLLSVILQVDWDVSEFAKIFEHDQTRGEKEEEVNEVIISPASVFEFDACDIWHEISFASYSPQRTSRPEILQHSERRATKLMKRVSWNEVVRFKVIPVVDDSLKEHLWWTADEILTAKKQDFSTIKDSINT